ncbi:MAG TPA: GNAT family N-acetyltransferase, partial [Micromonosporaceae bacterium]
MLRPATPADADDIRRWRNHDDVRAVSLSTHEIAPDEHAAWFASVLADPSRHVLVYEHDGRASGVVTFADSGGGGAYWGYFLDVDGLAARDETLPAWLRIGPEAVDYAFDVLGFNVLTGDVLADNVAVRRMNRRAGFTETDTRTVRRESDTVECWSIVLHRADRKPRREAGTN